MMKPTFNATSFSTVFSTVLLILLLFNCMAEAKQSAPAPVQERNVRAHMAFLASDALRGRGSATPDELVAALYIASQLQQFGVMPGGDVDAAGHKTFLQTVTLTKQRFAGPPKLSFPKGDRTEEWVHGQDILVTRMSAAHLRGPLQKLKGDEKPAPGAVVFLDLPEASTEQERRQRVFAALGQGAAVVLSPETSALREQWSSEGAILPDLPTTFSRSPAARSGQGSSIVVSTRAAKNLQQVADGTPIEITGPLGPAEVNRTWNVVGEIRGADPKLAREVILLSAHMDHLGVRSSPTADSSTDNIYNGADDNASGVVAVLELARNLAAGKKPKRTVYFVLFGSEERGGYGARYFMERPPAALGDMVANLNFEMIGRPDSKVATNTLWLTGFERSNLGSELAKRGARLVADPHPEQNFFQRSDNYTLALHGVIAHTVSSYGLHEEYHQPNDDLLHIDYGHMTQAIASMVQPLQWLVNASFRPTWAEGKKP